MAEFSNNRKLGNRSTDFVSVKDFGAVGDGVTDDTAAFEAARDSGARLIIVPQPSVAYIVEGFNPGNRMHYLGVGTRQEGSLLRSATTNKGIFEFTDGPAESIFEGLNFDATAEGVAAFVNTSGFGNYFQNCDIINCVFFQSLRYGIKANLILNNIDRCNFFQHGAAQGSQDRTAIHSEWDASSSTVNINNVTRTNIYNTKGVGVYLKRGFLFKFELVTFEALEDAAVEALGVDNIEFNNCWFENINDADHAVDLQLSTVGSNAAFINCKFDNNNGTNTFAQVASVGSSCTAKFERCTGNLASAYLTLKSGVFDDGLSYTQNNALTNYAGDREDRGGFKSIILNSGPEVFSARNSSLTDTPGSPETVTTFTVPAEPSGQNSYMALITGSLDVSAVATTTSIGAQNIQLFELYIFRGTDGVVSATLNTSGSTNNTAGGGSWSSAPVWSVSVSSDDVLLKVTSNPSGGSFAGGIKATVNGRIDNSSASGGGGTLSWA